MAGWRRGHSGRSVCPTSNRRGLSGADIVLPGVPSPLDIQLSLDTDRASPGTFSVRGETVAETGDRYAAAINGQWTGEALTATARLIENDETPLATAEVQAPLVLTRKNGQVGFSVPDKI